MKSCPTQDAAISSFLTAELHIHSITSFLDQFESATLSLSLVLSVIYVWLLKVDLDDIPLYCMSSL